MTLLPDPIASAVLITLVHELIHGWYVHRHLHVAFRLAASLRRSRRRDPDERVTVP